MGLFDRFRFRRKASDPLALLAEIMRQGASSKAGPAINLESALKVSTAFACLKVLSQGVAQVPFKLFQEVDAGGLARITPARGHPLYDLTNSKPNRWQTSYEFRETLVLHVALGNAYVLVIRSPLGGVLEMILLDPARMTAEQKEDRSIVYKYRQKDGADQEIPAAAIWHIRGPSWGGFAGLEVLKLAKEALGLAIATEETHSNLHAKGIKTSGTYSIDGTLNVQQYKDLKAWVEKEHAGAENSGAPMILDRGAKWLSQAMTGLDAQHLETRRFQIEEVCRFFGVMPIMVGYSDKATTYASSEQMFLAHVVHTLSPWYARIEQSADANLLTDRERRAGYYFKFVAAGLLRGAAKDRAEYFAKALGSGGGPAWMTQDEVRSLEELNPMGGAASALPLPTNVPQPAPV